MSKGNRLFRGPESHAAEKLSRDALAPFLKDRVLNSVQKFPDSRGKQRPIVSTPVCATIRSFGWRIWGDING
ncbi:hypothetical protein, partial [Pseudomonas gessardii]